MVRSIWFCKSWAQRRWMSFSEVLLQYIKDHEGFTPLNDKSAAEDIYDAFGVSKKTFKKAVGIYIKTPGCFGS